MNVFRVALLLAICSNATVLAMITIGDNGLKEATYHYLSPKGYRDIRLVSKSWAQYNNEPKHLYDSYSKNGKISSTCAFLVCVHKDEIFDTEIFLRHTNILAHLNECYHSKDVTLSPFTIASHNKNKKMFSLLNGYINKVAVEQINYSKNCDAIPQEFDFNLCLSACEGDSKKTIRELNGVLKTGKCLDQDTVWCTLWAVIQNYDISLLQEFLKFKTWQSRFKISSNRALCLISIFTGFLIEDFNTTIDFDNLTLTKTRLEKIKKFIDSGLFNVSINSERYNDIVLFLEKAAEKNQLFQEVLEYYKKS